VNLSSCFSQSTQRQSAICRDWVRTLWSSRLFNTPPVRLRSVGDDEKSVSQVLTDHIAAHALQLDSTDPAALKEAGIFEFDTVIVAIGNYLGKYHHDAECEGAGVPTWLRKPLLKSTASYCSEWEPTTSFILKTRPVVRWRDRLPNQRF